MANTFVTLQFIRMISLKRHKNYQQKMKILTGLPGGLVVTLCSQ